MFNEFILLRFIYCKYMNFTLIFYKTTLDLNNMTFNYRFLLKNLNFKVIMVRANIELVLC